MLFKFMNSVATIIIAKFIVLKLKFELLVHYNNFGGFIFKTIVALILGIISCKMKGKG